MYPVCEQGLHRRSELAEGHGELEGLSLSGHEVTDDNQGTHRSGKVFSAPAAAMVELERLQFASHLGCR